MDYASVGLLALTLHCIINLDYLKPRRSGRIPASMERYRLFLYSIAVFYLSDILWGTFTNNKLIVLAYLDAVIFFLAMVWSVLLWTRFVVAYLGRKDTFSLALTIGGWAIFTFDVIALLINFIKPIVFSYDADGNYVTGIGRQITLFAQLALYLATAAYTLAVADKAEGRVKMHHWSIGISGLVTTVFIALQALYPHSPFYSVGCLIGTCIIHTYVVQDEKTEHQRSLVTAKQIAYRDPLTGVKSKRAYQEDKDKFDHKISSLQLKELGVIVFDVNDLKKDNDNLGHEEGDKYIIAGCNMICGQFQHSPVYRIGGDEFVVILEGDDYRDRVSLLDEFDRQMEQNRLEGKLVISTGLDIFRPGRDIDFNSIFERADQRMYERKKALKAMPAPAAGG